MGNEYPPRVAKSEAMFANWDAGDGDMNELAIGLYDLVAEYKALWDDYAIMQEFIDDFYEWHEDRPHAPVGDDTGTIWCMCNFCKRVRNITPKEAQDARSETE